MSLISQGRRPIPISKKLLHNILPAIVPHTLPFVVPNPITFASLGMTRDATLLSKLASVATLAPNIGLVAIDMSTKKFATLNGSNLLFAGSISKLGIVIASYVLRESVKEFSKNSLATTANDLIIEIETTWKPIVTKLYAKPSDFPILKNIFTFTPPSSLGLAWNVEFTTTPSLLPYLSNEISSGPVNCRATLGYKQWMELTLHNSNNESASLCIDNIGFQYIQGALEKTGFLVKSGLGIWVGRAFRFSPNPNPKTPSKDWGFPPVIGGIQSATPDALAMLIVALNSNSLINNSNSVNTDIVTMLSGGAGSFMREALKNTSSSTIVNFAKDSKGANNLIGDLDVCTKGSTRFGVVMLSVPFINFDKVAIAMDAIF